MGVCTSQKPQQEKASKKGFLWGGSEGVDHVAIGMLRRDVANKGSQVVRPSYLVTLTDRCYFLCFSGQRGTIARYLKV